MIFIMVFVALIIMGGLCGALIKSQEDKFRYRWDCEFYADMIKNICIAIGLAGLIICLIIILDSNFGVNKKIYDAQLDRESIVQQLECVKSDYEDVSEIEVIDKVYQWNKEVHAAKYWSQNPWTNWFWNKEYVYSLKYIDMGD